MYLNGVTKRRQDCDQQPFLGASDAAFASYYLTFRRRTKSPMAITPKKAIDEPAAGSGMAAAVYVRFRLLPETDTAKLPSKVLAKAAVLTLKASAAKPLMPPPAVAIVQT